MLGRLLAELCRTAGDRGRREEVSPLREYVAAEARELSGESFTRFLSDLYRRIHSLLTSSEPSDRYGGVLAIDELIDVEILGEHASKISRFAGYLRDVFLPATDLATLELASRTMGHLVFSGGALTADVVESEVRRSLEWLQRSQNESRRYAAVLILREMAENAPAVFNVHVRAFIDAIWSALRDPKIHVRDAGVSALSACLCLVEKRETRYRVQWYYRLFEETQRGLTRSASMESVHGSLLALGELMNHTGEFMLARYREVVETVLKFRDSKERLIRRAVINLLPRLASFAAERFASTYLPLATAHLLAVLKIPAERGAAFTSLGGMATAVCCYKGFSGFMSCLPTLQALIRDAILSKRQRCPEALRCVGILALAAGPAWRQHVEALLDPMFSTGLSEVLVESLTNVANALPELLPQIQEQLLDLISLTLARQPFKPNSRHAGHLVQALASGELQGPPLTRLALQTLGDFEFGHTLLLDFVREHIVAYLDDSDVKTRKAAALACCHLLQKQQNLSGQGALQGAGLLGSPADQHAIAVSWGLPHPTGNRAAVEFIVQRLLASAVADIKVSVRLAVFTALATSPALDDHLCQVDCLRSLFVALNDEEFPVRAQAIQVTGRLADRNPAYVMPALRRHLVHLLTNMEHSPDSRNREESARLLGCLIQSAPRLIMPYVSPILKALVAKLKKSGSAALPPVTSTEKYTVGMSQHNAPPGKTKGKTSGEGGVTAAVLATLGDLASVAGTLLQRHVGEILPLIIDALQDTSSGARPVVAVTCLGQVVESTGIVVTPYMEYPQLMGLLLRLLSEGDLRARREVVKMLGIVGALDPHTHKCNQATMQGEGRLESEGVRAQRNTREGANGEGGGSLGGIPGDDYTGDLLQAQGLVTSSDEYYPTVAINALMRILRDPSMASHHPTVVRSLMFIFQALGLSCVPYLPKLMPVLFQCMRNCEDGLREFMFQQLTVLVKYVRQHIRKYLTDLLALVHEYWNSSPHLLMHILKLLAELSNVLRDDFRAYLPELLPKFIALFSEAERANQYTAVFPALQALEALGPAVEEHLHLVLPALVNLICPRVSSTPFDVRRTALQSMRRMLPCMQLGGYASAIVHPLVRVLEEGPTDDLRRDALDAICSMAYALGPDFAIFIPAIRKTCSRQRMMHEGFEGIANRMLRTEPPCMSDSTAWEAAAVVTAEEGSSGGGGGGAAALMPAHAGIERLKVNEANLKRAWESSHRCTKDDWAEWMRHFSVELLRESPSPALRACHNLAQVQPTMARELFAAGFVSCWSELHATHQEALVRSLEAALASPSIPPEIVTCLLNLAEFMEHDEKILPLDTRTLGALAEKCHAFAKALHYKEMEFQADPHGTVEALISINNHLRQPEAAVGMLKYAQQNLHMELKEGWYEKLQRWDDALAAYDQKAATAAPGSIQALDAALGRLRCLAALAEWERLGELCRDTWRRVEPHVRREMAPIAAHAAWHMGQWEEMHTYVETIDANVGSSSSTGAFLKAVLCVRRGENTAAMIVNVPSAA
uniref:Serine/threonine-protein kinase TOR n=1 Tax=Tetraselmis chuii TaxID=63592 RepID=A0A7S1SYY6_9CHLO